MIMLSIHDAVSASMEAVHCSLGDGATLVALDLAIETGNECHTLILTSYWYAANLARLERAAAAFNAAMQEGK